MGYAFQSDIGAVAVSKRIVAERGAPTPACLKFSVSWLLRCIRLALHPARLRFKKPVA